MTLIIDFYIKWYCNKSTRQYKILQPEKGMGEEKKDNSKKEERDVDKTIIIDPDERPSVDDDFPEDTEESE